MSGGMMRALDGRELPLLLLRGLLFSTNEQVNFLPYP